MEKYLSQTYENYITQAAEIQFRMDFELEEVYGRYVDSKTLESMKQELRKEQKRLLRMAWKVQRNLG
jgi:hypothetical protein